MVMMAQRIRIAGQQRNGVAHGGRGYIRRHLQLHHIVRSDYQRGVLPKDIGAEPVGRCRHTIALSGASPHDALEGTDGAYRTLPLCLSTHWHPLEPTQC